MSKILVIVPLYRNAHLFCDLVSSLLDAAADLNALQARLIFINDSPDDPALATVLRSGLRLLEGHCHAEAFINDQNIGFVRSCNRGLMMALEDDRDAVLLNSDALLTPGALAEMAAVSRLDPMIGFVSPRSNRATICNSPYPDKFRHLGFPEAHAAHREIEDLLPRVTYIPTAVGFCLYIRRLMLVEFGLLDDIYGLGYNEENDIIMRCNRRGYRAVMANHAFVHHFGSVSFATSDCPTSVHETRNRTILLDRYPEYEVIVPRYFGSIEYKAQYLLSGFVRSPSGRYRVLFDCSHLGTFYNGTFELVAKTVAEFARRHGYRYECLVCCNHAAYVFHKLDQIHNVAYVGERAEALSLAPFMAVIRLAQPFSVDDLVNLAPFAPIVGCLILDTIALDCQYLDKEDLTVLYNQMLRTTALLGYISEFTRGQFRLRFRVPTTITETVMLLSTDAAEYDPGDGAKLARVSGEPEMQGYILIVGNHFSHKHIRESVALFREQSICPPLVVLGIKLMGDEEVTSYQAGELDSDLVNRLYDKANIIFFPSHYEGFGLPIMHALAHRKPVVARALPVAEEIRARTQFRANLHLAGTTIEMVRLASGGLDWIPNGGPSPMPVQTWGGTADALERGLAEAQQRFRFTDLCDRLQSVAACKGYAALP
jgi:GT2 family glycosyltransferase